MIYDLMFGFDPYFHARLAGGIQQGNLDSRGKGFSRAVRRAHKRVNVLPRERALREESRGCDGALRFGRAELCLQDHGWLFRGGRAWLPLDGAGSLFFRESG